MVFGTKDAPNEFPEDKILAIDVVFQTKYYLKIMNFGAQYEGQSHKSPKSYKTDIKIKYLKK